VSVSSEDFLQQSRKLCELHAEIDFRSSISRGYYAVYHFAADTAQRLQLPDAKKMHVGVHERLISRFEAVGPGLRKTARKLRDLKRLRAMADYQLDEQVLREEAELCLAEASRLVEHLRNIGSAKAKVED